MATHAGDGNHGHEAHGTDSRAAFTGLVVGGILVFLILFGVVKATNAHFAKEAGAHPAAAATH